MTQPDSLQVLIQSTQALYARFGFMPGLEEAVLIFEEEVRELVEAARQGTDQAHIAEEAADVLVTAIGICLASGVDPELVVRQVYAVAEKNDAKTHQTHHVADGKIRRRTPRES